MVRKTPSRLIFFEYSLINEKGKRTYRNSWVTDVGLKKNNIEYMMKAFYFHQIFELTDGAFQAYRLVHGCT